MGFGDRDYYRPSGFGGFSFFPPVIKNLLIINIAVFFLQTILDSLMFGPYPGWYLINRYFALNPIIGYENVTNLPYNFQIWQLFTYQFLHGDFAHILYNLFALWMFGMEIENIWGSKKFLIFYLTCGVVGGLFQLLIGPFLGSAAPTIGASGAVFGVLVAFAMFFPDRYIYIYFLLPVKAKYLIVGYMVLQFMGLSGGGVIAYLAHIGGAFAGFAFVLFDKKRNMNFDRMFRNFKDKIKEKQEKTPFRKSQRFYNSDVQDADFYEINQKPKVDEITQEDIDKILDKISQSGYQNLTEKEKRILFEASKRK